MSEQTQSIKVKRVQKATIVPAQTFALNLLKQLGHRRVAHAQPETEELVKLIAERKPQFEDIQLRSVIIGNTVHD